MSSDELEQRYRRAREPHEQGMPNSLYSARRPIKCPPASVNQSAPSAPKVIPSGFPCERGIVWSTISPARVMRPSELEPQLVNQRSPSGPDTMPDGQLPTFASANYVMTPLGVIRPISSASASVNHKLPSAPGLISSRSRCAV